MEKDRTLFGTKVIDLKSDKQALILYTWKNVFADGVIDFATCVDKDGKKYNISLDNLTQFDVE